VIVYAEASAVLSWLLGEPPGNDVRSTLEAAEFVVTSELTLVECDRALHRAEALGELPADGAAYLRDALRKAASGWVLLGLDGETLDRARQRFPEEPIRSLDALHLASVLGMRELLPEAMLLTLDERVRRCATALDVPWVRFSD
jgi:predicted nucleic acid-binding protein